MSAPHYPDLTRDRVATADELLVDARVDMGPILDASRRRPIASAPGPAGTEPADFLALLHGSEVPVTSGFVPTAPSSARRGRPVHDHGVGDLLHAYATGALTVTEALAALRHRWSDAALAPGAVLAVVATVDDDAAESARRWREGCPRPLEGIFFGVKDIIDVAGAPITAGSLTTDTRIAEHDAAVVARLRAAGAIPALITATTEFACGAPHNARYGPVSNPWDTRRWTGGSSTGSAGALAAGLVPLALGTDTGGSIRVPSALCNLSGIKPSYGLVPRSGVASLSWSLDHIGPMARSAADLRLVLPHLIGPDAGDPVTAPGPVATAVRTRLTDAVRRIDGPAPRIGLPTSWFGDVCDHSVRSAWMSAVDTLATAGVEFVDIDLPDIGLMYDEFTVLLTVELASNQEARADRFAEHDLGTQIRIVRGTVPSGVDYLRALRRRGDCLAQAIAAFDDAGVDLLLTPGVGAVAPLLDELTMSIDGQPIPLQAIVGRNTSVFDHLGLPAAMVPAGLVDGLPVGVQIVGRPLADDAVLRLAESFQELTAHHLVRSHG